MKNNSEYLNIEEKELTGELKVTKNSLISNQEIS